MAFDGKPSLLDKLLNPALVDAGPANFKIVTAIDLVINYADKYPALDLSPYKNNYSLLVEDLMKEQSPLTAKLYGLYMKEKAEAFFKNSNAYGSQCDSLPQVFRDALLVTYTNIGEKGMEKLKNENYLSQGLPYEPQPALLTGGGMNHLLNASTIGNKIGLIGYGADVGNEADFAALAKANTSEAISYRYALKNLRYVALPTLDYSSRNQNGELDLYNKETGEGELSEQYLTDRALFLTNVIAANLADTGSGKALWTEVFTSDTLYFKDEASGLSLQQQNPVTGTSSGPKHLFGGSGNDTFWGGDEADHLYGGAGMDRLDGAKGADYLEGNAGSDILAGGDDNDTLIGGAGDDLLDGGKGSDTLNGGLGNDTYKVGGGNGWDWLEDQDGIGKLLYTDSQGGADILLTGGTPVTGTANVWKQESNGKTLWYLLTDWTENGQTFQRLSIEGPDGGVFIKNWSAGQLGITLPGAQAETPAPAVLTGTAGTDKLHAQSNEAVITGNGGADLLEAGSVSTALYADEVIPNLTQYVADTAPLTGGGYLEAGALQGGSVLVGSHGGDDTVVGGTGNDALFGGGGRDLLIGGGGADLILGDGRYQPTLTLDGAYTGWQLAAPPGQFAIAGSGFTEAVYSAGHPANDDADIIHGGGGNDLAWGGFGDDLLYGERVVCPAADDRTAGFRILRRVGMEKVTKQKLEMSLTPLALVRLPTTEQQDFGF